jgi:RNA polymerase sigma-70 factor (ECF subfamily)
MSTRNLTVTDLQRLDALAGDAEVAFQMDEQTFRAFYDRTARPLWAYLSRITGDRQLSDDLLQDAYYRFLRADATYENEAHRRNALFRIATNLARDSHRRARVRPLSKTTDDDVAMVADQRVDVAGQLQRKTDLGRAMQHLKPRERALLWLAYAEGSSHREIATAVGVKLASVKLLLFRARRKLAGLLEEKASS